VGDLRRSNGLRPRFHAIKERLRKIAEREGLLRGGYPELAARPELDSHLWHASYIQTYLERDVRTVRQVGDLSQYQTFLRALAARSAQLLSLTTPSVEFLPVEEGVVWAKKINDYFAEVCAKYPGRFYATATLPYQDVDESLKELDRAYKELGVKGITTFSNIDSEPIASPHFYPIYAKAAEYKLPIFVHPGIPYTIEITKRLNLSPGLYAFTVDTTMAVMSLIWQGVLERFPGLTILHAHLGGVVPYTARRLDDCWRTYSQRAGLQPVAEGFEFRIGPASPFQEHQGFVEVTCQGKGDAVDLHHLDDPPSGGKSCQPVFPKSVSQGDPVGVGMEGRELRDPDLDGDAGASQGIGRIHKALVRRIPPEKPAEKTHVGPLALMGGGKRAVGMKFYQDLTDLPSHEIPGQPPDADCGCAMGA